MAARDALFGFYYLGWPGDAYGPVVYGDPVWTSEFPILDWSEGVEFESILCPDTWKHGRAGSRVGTLRVDISSLGVGDFMWTFASECLVTKKVLELFERHGISGFKTRPVSITEVGSLGVGSSLALRELVPTGRGGDAHPASGVNILYEHEPCGLRIYSSFKSGIIVDARQWDGSDLFTVSGYPKFMIVTERVKDLIAQNRLTNCVLIRANDLEWGETLRPEDVDYALNED
jgi:hypothetical protein